MNRTQGRKMIGELWSEIEPLGKLRAWKTASLRGASRESNPTSPEHLAERLKPYSLVFLNSLLTQPLTSAYCMFLQQQRPGPPQCPTQSWGECQTSLSSQGLLCPMSALSTLWYLAMAPKSVSFSESARQEKSNGLLPHFQ